MKLEDIAKILGCRLDGDGEVEIHSVSTLEAAQPGQLSFLANARYFKAATRTQASAIIVGEDCPPLHTPLLRDKNPYLKFARALEIFHPRASAPGSIHPTAVIADSAKVAADVEIGPFSYIADGAIIEPGVKLGAHCVVERNAFVAAGSELRSGCVIAESVVIGERCVIQSNAVVGADGFGFAKNEDKSWYKIPQVGLVILESDVEVGACTTIDRASVGETRIAKGAKLDNLVQVGHGSTVGANSLLCAQVGLAGSSDVGENVILAGQAGVSGHLKIGDGAIVTAQAGIPGDVPPNAVVSGSPSFDNKQWLRATAIFSKLPELYKALRNLEKRLAILEDTLKKTL